MQKSLIVFLLVLIIIVPITSLCPSANASTTFTLQPPSSAHVCRINFYNWLDGSRLPGPLYSYVGGIACYPDFSYNHWSVNKVSITAGFGGTTPSKIGSGNWLAAGMFLEGMDHVVGGEDYAYYDVIVLDNQGNLYLDVGAWAENDAFLTKGALRLLTHFRLCLTGVGSLEG